MTPDSELLATFAQTNSEDAFAELVKRHVNLVYSAALRQAGGDAHLAQDVAQTVFSDLARKAGALARRETLSGWLYTSAHFAAAKIVRAETRRRDREEKFMREPTHETAPEPDWETLRPLLDSAMHDLKEADRDAILLRYFENRQFAEVGTRLGLNENAARMRVDRALEKLRAALARRGLTATVTLAATISAHAIQVAPAGLTGTLTATSITAAGTGTFTLLKIMTLTKIKLAIGSLVVAGTATALVLQHQAQSQLRTDNVALTQQLAQLKSDNDTLSNRLASPGDSQKLPDGQLAELLKLRGEVGTLRQQVSQYKKASEEQAQNEQRLGQQLSTIKAETDLARAKAQFKVNELRTINNMKQIGLAFRIFAGDHADQPPTNIDQVDFGYYGQTNLLLFAQNEIELLNTTVPNLYNYPNAIEMRERTPRQDPDGRWKRTYGLANGSVQEAASADGNFEEWEKRNTQTPPQNP
ncbi:MAG: sigma-70 family RNA polymerase sigma factor [Verrucomicrobiae bacterium]|nr:sigma-70 family RNA polymerase sigma factor [Verrucomicrobiae bacterium]